ncbi:MAG: MFS transporter [Bacillus sp. (in: firmicutes)]
MMKQVKSSSVLVLYLICISAFFASLNQNIYAPIIPLLRDSFHVSINIVNLSVSMFIFITAIMQIILGALVDFKGNRFVLIPGIILTVLASIGCAMTNNFTVFFICRALQAIGTAAIPLIAATTIGSMFEGDKRGSAMGTYQTLLSIAPTVAPLIGGLVGGKYNYQGIFWFITGISVVLFLTNFVYFPKDTQSEKKSMSIDKIFGHYMVVFKNKIGNSIFILSFFIFFIYFAIIVYLPVLLTDYYQLNLQLVGFLYLPIALSLVIGSFTFKKMQSKIPLIKLSIFVNILLVFSLILFAITSHWHLIALSLSLILYGLSTGFITPLYGTIITNEFKNNRASAMGMFNFIRYVGMSVGPIVSGFLLNKFPSIIVFGMFGVVFALLALIIWTGGNLKKVQTLIKK